MHIHNYMQGQGRYIIQPRQKIYQQCAGLDGRLIWHKMLKLWEDLDMKGRKAITLTSFKTGVFTLGRLGNNSEIVQRRTKRENQANLAIIQLQHKTLVMAMSNDKRGLCYPYIQMNNHSDRTPHSTKQKILVKYTIIQSKLLSLLRWTTFTNQS